MNYEVRLLKTLLHLAVSFVRWKYASETGDYSDTIYSHDLLNNINDDAIVLMIYFSNVFRSSEAITS